MIITGLDLYPHKLHLSAQKDKIAIEPENRSSNMVSFHLPKTYFYNVFSKLLLVGWLLGVLVNIAFTQKPGEVDSLRATLDNPSISDSLKVVSLKQLAFYSIERGDSSSSILYLDRIKKLSEEVGYEYGLLIHHFWYGYYYFRSGNYKPATRHLLKAAAYGTSLNRPAQAGESYSRVALVYDIRGLIDSARYCLNLAIQQAEKLQDFNLITLNKTTLGNIENRAGNHLDAIKQFISVDSICNEAEDPMHYRQGLALHNIGIIYLDNISDYNKALWYMQKAVEAYRKKENNAEQLDAANHTIAKILIKTNQFQQADSLLQTVLSGFKSRGLKRKIAEISMDYGSLKEAMDQQNDAENLFLGAEEIYREIGDSNGLANVSARLGILYQKKLDFTKSISYLNNSIGPAIGISSRTARLKALAESYRQNGQLNAAYDSLMSFVILTDSFNNQQQKVDLQEAEMKYQTAQKEREIIDLKLDKSEQTIKAQRFLYFGFGLLAALLGVVYFFYYRSKQRKKINAQLKELDEFKSRFFADISHELRTPISLIKGPVDMILQEESISNSVRQQLQMVNRNANRLNRLVNSINRLNRLQESKESLDIKKVDLNSHLNIIAASFDSMAKMKKLTFDVNLEGHNTLCYYDPECLETIVYNLLSNAFKFTEKGKITLSGKVESGWATVEVKDTGIGFSELDRENIFNRYFRIKKEEYHAEGLGIGLALSNRLAQLHKGHLKVHSKEHVGTSFKYAFPIQKRVYEKEGLLIDESLATSTSYSIDKRAKSPTATLPAYADEPLILLVEDNQDMRDYLESLFRSEYRILTAKNGEEGFNMASKYVPDLIISDLMMPVKDGAAFLQETKSDVKTSHIPFILLTANHDEQQKLVGLKTGADDYMTKPFSLEELKIKVENLIKIREQIRNRYHRKVDVSTKSISTNKTDLVFWGNLEKTLEQNLSNPHFSVQDFASALFMSRMQLHRKLKALTNQSTTAFLRNQRLKLAAQLLKENNLSISNVAYEVGFSSPFYFTNCFKELYGVTPSEYASSI